MLKQQVKVFGHRSRQRVLNGNDRRLRSSSEHALEDVGRTCTRNYSAARHHGKCSFMAKRTGFALNRNFHSAVSAWNRVLGSNESAAQRMIASSAPSVKATRPPRY